ncbi:MerR family transcriptional regulator [Paenibacillus daejeonensis]|uniref:MerR family transcriptional regulator n=1 Tax=Paenibacillus daejeonensis TaxID=135193 RepID=UPI0003827363|nr:MerR family transcriptional regulator [Paenibacillus daejeonensis]
MYKEKKVIAIGLVSELTGLSERKIRYYEERRLIFPERTAGGTRKYSFSDIERLCEIAEKMEDGLYIREIKEMERRKVKRQTLPYEGAASFTPKNSKLM